MLGLAPKIGSVKKP